MSALSVLSAIAACALGACAGIFLGEFAHLMIVRRHIASSIGADSGKGHAIAIVKSGVRPILPACRSALEGVPALDDAVEAAASILAEKGLEISKAALLSDLAAVSISASILGAVMCGSPVFGLALGCILFIGVLGYAKSSFVKMNVSMREEIPDALRTLSTLFRSGHSLPQALYDSAQESKGYLSHLFLVASDRIGMGSTPEEALAVMRGNPRAPELSFVAVALDIQHQSGGQIALVLESAMESIEGELKLARSLRVQTAQAKLSASIVTVMPFILVALFSFFSPDFLSPFFESALGIAVLAIAVAMQVTGVLIVRRMLNTAGD